MALSFGLPLCGFPLSTSFILVRAVGGLSILFGSEFLHHRPRLSTFLLFHFDDSSAAYGGRSIRAPFDLSFDTSLFYYVPLTLSCAFLVAIWLSSFAHH